MKQGKKLSKEETVQRILEYRESSERAKVRRRKRNRFNWDMYNLKQDWSHKRDGQSREFFPKMALGLENFTSTSLTMLTQNSDDWFTVDKGLRPDPLFSPDVVRNILNYHLYWADAITKIAAMMKYVALDARVTLSIGGDVQVIPRFKMNTRTAKFDEQLKILAKVKGKDKKIKTKPMKRWHLDIGLVDWEDSYPDPLGDANGKLFDIRTVEMDRHVLYEMYEENPDVFDKEELSKVESHFVKTDKKMAKAQKRGEDVVGDYGKRRRCLLTIMYGDLLDDEGLVHPSMKNVYAIVANDKYLVVPPRENDNWDGESDLVSATLIEVYESVFGKALMDSPAALNKTYNEAMNLMLDGMFDAIKGIKQLKPGFLKNPAQASGDILSGMTLHVEDDIPLGEEVLKKLKTGDIPQEAMLFVRELVGELHESMMVNELKLGGFPAASTKATIAQMADQASSNIFGGMIRVFEDKCIVPMLSKCWLTVLQNMDKDYFADEEMIALIGRGKAAALLTMPAEERFLRGANAAQFRVRGISGMVQKIREFQKLTQFLQVIGRNEMLLQAFAQQYDISKFLGYVVSATGIREDLIKKDQDMVAGAEMRGQVSEKVAQILGELKGGGQGRPTPGSVNAGSVAPTPQGGRPPDSLAFEGDMATSPQGPKEGNI